MSMCIHDYFRIVQVFTGKYKVQEFCTELYEWKWHSTELDTLEAAIDHMKRAWIARKRIIEKMEESKKEYQIIRYLSRDEIESEALGVPLFPDDILDEFYPKNYRTVDIARKVDMTCKDEIKEHWFITHNGEWVKLNE